MGFFDIFKSKGNEFTDADKAKLNSIDELRRQIEAIKPLDTSKFLTEDDLPDMTKYARKDDIPSVSGLASKSDIPEPLDLSGYMQKTDTVKYIENSNTTSKIKRFTLSIEDKATFDPKKNPNDNIAHSI